MKKTRIQKGALAGQTAEGAGQKEHEAVDGRGRRNLSDLPAKESSVIVKVMREMARTQDMQKMSLWCGPVASGSKDEPQGRGEPLKAAVGNETDRRGKW